jgi:hypothetical protein
MEKRRRRKHQSHQRSLVIVNEHRPFLVSSPAGTITVETLDHAVTDEATALTDQEHGRFEREAATDLVDQGRGWLQQAVKHFARASAVAKAAGAAITPFDGSRPATDDQLVTRAETIHAAVSAEPDTFVKGGITPARIDALGAALAAFKKAKDTMTLASKQHNEATERFDQAAGQGSDAIAVLEGVLTLEPNAPAGARNALRQAKRIGPRIAADVVPEESGPAPATPPPTPTTPATPPVSHATV